MAERETCGSDRVEVPPRPALFRADDDIGLEKVEQVVDKVIRSTALSKTLGR